MKLVKIVLLGIPIILAIGCSSLARNKEEAANKEETVYTSTEIAATTEESSEVSHTASAAERAREIDKRPANIVSVFNFGAVGDGVIDDTEAIQKAIESNQPIYFPHGVYAISRPIVITDKSNWSLYAQDAEFLYTGNEYAFRILSAQNCRIEIGQIRSIEGGGIEFYSDSVNSWNQYVSLTFNIINCKTDCIHVEVMNGGWSNENRVYGGRFMSGKNGVHVLNTGRDFTNGWKFYNCGIEGVTNGFLFNAGRGNINDMTIISPRYEESYETILKTFGDVFDCLWIGTGAFKPEDIECSSGTNRFEVIAPIETIWDDNWHRGCIINGNLMAEKTEYELVQ